MTSSDHHRLAENPLDDDTLDSDEQQFQPPVAHDHPHAATEPHQDAHAHGGHVHSHESQRRIINRLSRLEGHIRGIKTMVQDGRSCPDVLVQIAAVRGALNRAGRMILDEHLTECVARAAEAGTIETEIEELKAALDRFMA
jgi:CsoR family transcriptional regulator, copper-sensing transcriptional repressor